MFKQFHSIWKNATLNKSQIVLRRLNSSSTTFASLPIGINDLPKLKLPTHWPNQRTVFCVWNPCTNWYIIKRCISRTAVKEATDLNRSVNIQSKYKEMEANLKWRPDPVIVTLDTPQFKSILRKNIVDLVAIFQKNNYEIRIAGGAVR